jgi:hypothetical protein
VCLVSYFVVQGKAEELNDRLNDEDQPEGKNVLWLMIIGAIAAFQV